MCSKLGLGVSIWSFRSKTGPNSIDQEPNFDFFRTEPDRNIIIVRTGNNLVWSVLEETKLITTISPKIDIIKLQIKYYHYNLQVRYV